MLLFFEKSILLKETPSLHFLKITKDKYHYLRVKYVIMKNLIPIHRWRRGYLKLFSLSLPKNLIAQNCRFNSRSYSVVNLIFWTNCYFMFTALSSLRLGVDTFLLSTVMLSHAGIQ